MPVIYNHIEQGTEDWFLIRQGIPTASEFNKLLTGASRQFSEAGKKYAREKVGEIITGQQQGSMYISDDMELGQITEQEAADSYEYANDVKTEKIGFVTDDDGQWGCSPDRFVGKTGIVEIKRKNVEGMVKYLLERRIDPAHKAQIQGNLFTCGREWCDWHLYNPDMPRLTIRTYRDDRYIADLHQDLLHFRKLTFKWLGELAEYHGIDLQEIAERGLKAREHIIGKKVKAPYLVGLK